MRTFIVAGKDELSSGGFLASLVHMNRVVRCAFARRGLDVYRVVRSAFAGA